MSKCQRSFFGTRYHHLVVELCQQMCINQYMCWLQPFVNIYWPFQCITWYYTLLSLLLLSIIIFQYFADRPHINLRDIDQSMSYNSNWDHQTKTTHSNVHDTWQWSYYANYNLAWRIGAQFCNKRMFHEHLALWISYPTISHYGLG
jgi:hypothetical protein